MKKNDVLRGMILVAVSLVTGIGVFNLPVSYSEDRLLVKDGSGNTKLVITDQGNIGVGTLTPQQKVDLGEERSR